MARLIDTLFANEKNIKSSFLSPSLFEGLRESEVILIDNVAKYFFESPKDDWFLKDFPNIAPPFDDVFLEFNTPKQININGDVTHAPNTAIKGRVGVLLSASDIEEKVKNPVKWLYHALVIVHDHGKILPPILYKFSANKDGSVTFDDSGDKPWLGMNSNGLYGRDLMMKGAVNFLYPCFLAISFLHCKNVTMKRETPPAPLSKKYQKKHGRPLVSYHTLNIEPMKKILRTEGDSEKTGLQQALHICRGHFKDFSKGKGLFGKFKGLYWWDSQVRGAVSAGIVDKDYRIKV